MVQLNITQTNEFESWYYRVPQGAWSVTEKAPTSVFPLWETRARLSGQTIWPGEIFLAYQVLGLPCYAKAFLDNVESYRKAVAKELERLCVKGSLVFLTMKTFLKSILFYFLLKLMLYGYRQRTILYCKRLKPCERQSEKRRASTLFS